MIIIKLQGGLGNQMFQYAFGKTLSKQRNDILLFDPFFYGRDEDEKMRVERNFELNLFHTGMSFASRQQVKKLLEPTLSKCLLQRLGVKSKNIYKETTLAFNKEIFKLSSPIYFDGYWQSELYFKKNISEIRKHFTFKESLNRHSSDLKFQMREKKNSVSIHFRRADYITTPHVNAVHGTCTLEYYTKAITFIRQTVAEPFFYLFSDDPDWVNKNFANILDDYYLVDHNQGPDSWQDMALMSFCHHHIIANSTFSWWGAWLNPSNSKITIAPKKWFADSELNKQTNTLIPQNWVRI